MKPVPSTVLCILILSLCALCAWQWHRENQLRQIASLLRTELEDVVAQRNELETRAKTADSEILRLTGTVAELRDQSVSLQVHNDLIAANTQMREALAEQNVAIKSQADTLIQANASILKANESVRNLTAERDGLAQKINEITAMYNALAAKRQ